MSEFNPCNNKDRPGIKNKNTFIVKINGGDNNTWQGQIVWAEENKSVRFRSALELIKLMDEAMSAGAQMTSFEQEISVS